MSDALWTLLIVFPHSVGEPVHMVPFMQTATQAECAVQGKVKLADMKRLQFARSTEVYCVLTRNYNAATNWLLPSETEVSNP